MKLAQNMTKVMRLSAVVSQTQVTITQKKATGEISSDSWLLPDIERTAVEEVIHNVKSSNVRTFKKREQNPSSSIVNSK